MTRRVPGGFLVAGLGVLYVRATGAEKSRGVQLVRREYSSLEVGIDASTHVSTSTNSLSIQRHRGNADHFASVVVQSNGDISGNEETHLCCTVMGSVAVEEYQMLLHSLVEAGQAKNIVLHVATNTSEDKRLIDEAVSKHGFKPDVRLWDQDVTESWAKEIHLANSHHSGMPGITKIFLYRIFSELSRCIVHDTDIFFGKPASALWSEFGNFGPKEIVGATWRPDRLPGDKINAGVMLMDFARMRHVGYEERMHGAARYPKSLGRNTTASGEVICRWPEQEFLEGALGDASDLSSTNGTGLKDQPKLLHALDQAWNNEMCQEFHGECDNQTGPIPFSLAHFNCRQHVDPFTDDVSAPADIPWFIGHRFRHRWSNCFPQPLRIYMQGRLLVFVAASSRNASVSLAKKNVEHARRQLQGNVDFLLAHYDGHQADWAAQAGEAWYNSNVRYYTQEAGYKFQVLRRLFNGSAGASALIATATKSAASPALASYRWVWALDEDVDITSASLGVMLAAAERSGALLATPAFKEPSEKTKPMSYDFEMPDPSCVWRYSPMVEVMQPLIRATALQTLVSNCDHCMGEHSVWGLDLMWCSWTAERLGVDRQRACAILDEATTLHMDFRSLADKYDASGEKKQAYHEIGMREKEDVRLHHLEHWVSEPKKGRFVCGHYGNYRNGTNGTNGTSAMANMTSSA